MVFLLFVVCILLALWFVFKIVPDQTTTEDKVKCMEDRLQSLERCLTSITLKLDKTSCKSKSKSIKK